MSAPEAHVLHKVRQWLEFADEDLRLARHGLTMTIASPPYRLIAYHAQQCAEKCLKAYLVLRRVDFPYTHNLAHLLDLCAAHASWADSLRDAEELTPFAITARYPGEDEEVTREEAVRAIDVADRVRTIVQEAVREAGSASPSEATAS
jgi:HEPN domain-containing protein